MTDLMFDAIDHAFVEQVSKLYAVLCSSLATTDDHEGAQNKFSLGLECAVEARKLAREAVEDAKEV